MELRHLRYFIAVAEELHFGKAAEKLFIAQPPLSLQIQQLERELGFRLFNRTNRKVELTAAGQMFLEEARETLAGLERAAHAGRRIAKGEEGWLGIGFVGSATYHVLPVLLSAFRERYPDVQIVLRELVSGRQVLALRNGRIHVGLARPPIVENDLVSEVITREALFVALPVAHPLAGRSTIRLSALSDEPFILYPMHPPPSYGEFLRKVCEEMGFRPHIIQEAAEIHTAISLVAAGIGITLVPESVMSAHREGVTFVRLSKPSPITEMAVSYRRGDDSATLRNFVELARNTVSKQELGDSYHPVNSRNSLG